MKVCKVCQAESEDSAARCSGCGRPFLFGTVSERKCPQCHRGNPRTAEKCVYCGTDLIK